MSEQVRSSDEVSAEEGPAAVVRSATDVLRLVVSAAVLLAVLVLGLLFDDAIVGFTADLLRGFDALPSWFVSIVGVGGRILALVLLGGGLIATLARARWRMLATLAVAGVLGGGLFVIFDPMIERVSASATQLEVDLGIFTEGEFPHGVVVAIITAWLTAAAPWVGRGWRRAGWALVVLLACSRFLVAPVSFDTLLALSSGWAGGSAALVAMGAPTRRPTVAQVSEGLAGVGLPVVSLEKAGVDARGSTPYFGVGVDGCKLFVKVLGDDERSADLLFRLYRWVLPRSLGDERPFSSLRRAVEHEALVALAARDLGVRTPRLLAFATAEPDACVLAYEAIAGRSFDRLEAAEVSDEILDAVWGQVGLLQAHRIAHRDLRLANIFLDDNREAWMIDFGFSELAASDLLLATDLAELLASSSLQVGVDRAVAAGERSIGGERLRAAIPRLDPKYLSGATRTGMKERSELMPALRASVASLAPTGS